MIIFGSVGVGGLWSSEKGVLMFCMASVAGAVRSLSVTFCATVCALPRTNLISGLRLSKFR